MIRRAILFLSILFLGFSAEFLHLGPLPKGSSLKIEPFSAVEGKEIKIYPGFSLKWEKAPSSVKTEPSSVHYFALYILTDWGKRKIKISSNAPAEVSLDGHLLGKGKEVEACRLLEKGKHFLLIKVESSKDGKIDLKLSGDFSTSLSPEHNLSLWELMNSVRVTRGLPSQDGKFVLVEFRKWNLEGKEESWYEVYSLKSRKVLRSFKGFKLSLPRWRPGHHQLSYKIKDSLWIADLEGKNRKLLEAKNLSSYMWSKDGSFLIYTVYHKRKEYNKFGLNRVKDPAYRQRGWGGKNEIHIFWPEGEIDRKLITTQAEPLELSPDGKTLLLSLTYFDADRRPYLMNKYMLLDLESGKVQDLIRDPWINSVKWSPDGEKLLLVGGPSSFSGVCLKLKKGEIPNDYNGELMVYHLKSRKVECLTREFYPAVLSAYWLDNEKILFTAEDRTYVRLYLVEKGIIKETPAEGEVVRSLQASPSGVISAIATGVNLPHRLLVMKEGKILLRLFPARKKYSLVRWGKVEDWDLKIGKYPVKGRIYYPPNFDPAKKYPLIIYYYGGTSPISRDFAGRYPKEWWAAKGFVVYTLTPPGATGFGQWYSAKHVNDWGKLSGRIILEASKRFVKEHPWVDKKGIIGASFGGFMTQYLVTKTGFFDAAVSHAGISMIPSYWGEGYWGYTYNAISAAFSFPWNRKDIYVGRSPLFFAHKVKTPLLLLHGTDDTNVPPGESHQMFTALKLLKRPVALVLVKGENHWVLGYKHRIGWYMAIMGWFEKYLRGNSALWDSLFEDEQK